MFFKLLSYKLRNAINYVVGDDRRHMTASELMDLHARGEDLPFHPVLHAEKNNTEASYRPLPACYRSVMSETTSPGYIHDITINGVLELRDGSFTCVNVTADKVIASTKKATHRIDFLQTSISEIVCDGVEDVVIQHDHELKVLTVDDGKKLSVDGAEELSALYMYDLRSMNFVDLRDTPKLKNSISVDVFHPSKSRTIIGDRNYFIVGKFCGNRDAVVEKCEKASDLQDNQSIVDCLKKLQLSNRPV